LSVFDWAKFRCKKGAVKMHCLFDIKAQIPVFNVITPAKEAEVTVAKNTDFKLVPDSIVVFDRAYNDFDLFQSYEEAGAFFVTRAKKNLRFELLGQQEIPKNMAMQ
ncbi:MAG: transposase, partial [bacterium]|nr:transposase [bacterium]